LEKDRGFILIKISTPERVRGIFFFPRLFLDSPPETPYLVCVMNPHHKIRYHESRIIPAREQRL
jgi:hypothetical protein